ncbi:MAG: hypothetical protein KKD46_07370, partial [Euryarchaeota archaeon]|nr:hypothetical protein [Euryarchaeota archaeon]MCG2738222.1 hypothetical protein [Candidatus Methanoperedenaceae archaeon]
MRIDNLRRFNLYIPALEKIQAGEIQFIPRIRRTVFNAYSDRMNKLISYHIRMPICHRLMNLTCLLCTVIS